MGQPTWAIPTYPPLKSIGGWRGTGGTETSQYLEEQTSTEIPSVVASERGPAQTGPLSTAVRGCRPGQALGEQQTRRTALERPTTAGESPVVDNLHVAWWPRA
jgi:hypothetical protein